MSKMDDLKRLREAQTAKPQPATKTREPITGGGTTEWLVELLGPDWKAEIARLKARDDKRKARMAAAAKRRRARRKA